MKVLVFILALLTLDGARASEFSVRCEGGTPARPYFATFDTAARKVVFETAPPNIATSDGTNVLTGEINRADGQTDGKIEFTLRAPDGQLNLTLDPKMNRMIWPGITSADPFRPTLSHSCVVTPPRSILSFRSLQPIAHPITIQCEDAGYMYLTMDAESKKAIFERGGMGSLYKGEVTSAEGNNINLLMNFSGSSTVVSWNRSSQTMTVEGTIGGLDSHNTKPCREIAPRTMIEYYKMIRKE